MKYSRGSWAARQRSIHGVGARGASKAISARYDGQCGACGGDFKAGQMIRHDGNGWGHDLCVSAANGSAEQRAAQGEYAKGVQDYNQWKFESETFGEEYAAAEEHARYMRFGDD